jgi:hypothetical protein
MFYHIEQPRPFREVEILAENVNFEEYLEQFDGL